MKYTPAVLALIAFFLLFVTREHATNKKDVSKKKEAEDEMDEMDEMEEEQPKKKLSTPKKR